MISMKKVRFSSRLGAKVRHKGPLGSARTQPWKGLPDRKPPAKIMRSLHPSLGTLLCSFFFFPYGNIEIALLSLFNFISYHCLT